MALLDFLRRKFPNANLIAPRIDTPRPVPLTEAVPNNEWEGDYPLWNWDAASIQNAAIPEGRGLNASLARFCGDYDEGQ
jgi:hypothetical protein